MELWKPVRDYEGWYEVSDVGRIRRIMPGKGTRPGQIIKPTISTRGRLQVSLSRRGEQHTLPIHVLVAHAFIGPRPEGMEINHIDLNHRNNVATNLEYVTPRGNINHAYSHAEHRERTTRRGMQNGNAKLTDGDVLAIRASAIPRDKIAAIYGVSPCTIKFIRNRRQWKHVA